jgi:hypothetical protein
MAVSATHAEHGSQDLWAVVSGGTAILRSRDILQDPYRFGNTVLGWVQPLTDADGEMADFRLGTGPRSPRSPR